MSNKSNLLEQAIIDASALKEAALKNAEQMVIEKYSEEVKNAVNSLIEQDMGLDTAMQDMDMGAPESEPALDLGQEDATGTEDAQQPDQEEEPALDKDSIIGSLPDSFNSDDELVTIKLDSLEADYEDEEVTPFASGEELGDDEIGIDILNLDDIVTDDETEPSLDASPGTDVDIDITDDIVQEVLDELGLDSEEVDLEEITEKIRVDFEPQKSGWAGTPESIMREYESMLVAREQDEEVKEENEELRKTVSALQKENNTLTSAAKKLQMQTEKYETAFNTLQEKLETMNVSNAKLLYINQALENASLNERQKRKIVEAISKAETVQEAKIVFDTMNDTVTTTSDVKKDATLNEMVSRRSSLLVAARNEQNNMEANPMYNRMQKLAGIKTK